MTQKAHLSSGKFSYWLNHFKRNQNQFSHINWKLNDALSAKEAQIITSSIQQFQKGENSEGKHLILYAKKHGDPIYLETIKLFIKEEQTHALILGKYMKTHNIKKIKAHWIDDVFRGLRKLSSLENSIIVLLTAEIIAAIYYIALRESTHSKTLKDICNQILLDEEIHINFQSFTLSQFYQNKSLVSKIHIRLFHRILMTGTTLIVWAYHKKVLKHGGFSFSLFYQSVFREYFRSENIIKNKHSSYQNTASTLAKL